MTEVGNESALGWRWGAALVAGGAAALLVAGWLLRGEGPREPSFPSFEAKAPFPELTLQAQEAPEEDGEAPGPSRFEAALRTTVPAPPDPTSPAAEPPPLVVPLGGGLVADLPARPRNVAEGPSSSWHWASRPWGSLAVHSAGNDRPDALIYAELIAPLYARRPSVELLRFHLTAVPASVVDLPAVGSLWRALEQRGGTGSGDPRSLAKRARALRLATTATGGRGLGFVPAEDGTLGTRWAGRNEHRVILRLARFEGSWQGQEATAAGPDGDPAGPPALTRVPASLLLGHAVTAEGVFGTHLAILCTRAPDCPTAEDLATFLASVRPGAADRVVRLRGEAQGSFDELAARAGLELTAPEHPDSSPRVRGHGGR